MLTGWPVYADGHIHFMNEDCESAVIAPGGQFKLLATKRLDGRSLASIAVSDRAIFVRSDAQLYRIEAPSSATTSAGLGAKR
jgi:hypothetical protein